MPKFLALIKGTGEGCDYTLGCNQTWNIKEAPTKENFIQYILEEYGMTNFDRDYFPDIMIEELEIIEIDTIEKITGIPEWYEQQWKLAKEQSKVHEERKLYEELKAKFENQ